MVAIFRLKPDVAKQCQERVRAVSEKQKRFKKHLAKSSEARVIKKGWILTQRKMECQLEKQALPPRRLPAQVLERILFPKRLRIPVAANVALAASIIAHPYFTVFFLTVKIAPYT